MPSEALVADIKKIVQLLKVNQLDEAYRAYAALYAAPSFLESPASDRHHALKLMVLAKGVPQIPTKTMIEAHRVALAPLRALIAETNDPSDYELLGVCEMVTGDEKGASKTFMDGLTLERGKNPQSDLCGALMKRVASV